MSGESVAAYVCLILALFILIIEAAFAIAVLQDIHRLLEEYLT